MATQYVVTSFQFTTQCCIVCLSCIHLIRNISPGSVSSSVIVVIVIIKAAEDEQEACQLRVGYLWC